MNETVIFELIKRWESDAKEPEGIEASAERGVKDAVAKGHREAKRECADTLRTLQSILGNR